VVPDIAAMLLPRTRHTLYFVIDRATAVVRVYAFMAHIRGGGAARQHDATHRRSARGRYFSTGVGRPTNSFTARTIQ
jgi:hypothetical protein